MLKLILKLKIMNKLKNKFLKVNFLKIQLVDFQTQ